MGKIFNFLLNIFEIPIVLPTMVIYQFYVINKIVNENYEQGLDEITTPDELEKVVRPYTDKFFLKYKVIMYSVSIIFWLQLIKYIIF